MGTTRTARAEPRPWAFWPLRVLVTLAATLLFVQAVLAGQFLSGSYGSLLWHQNNAALTDMVLIAAIPAGVLVRWPGRGPLWPTFAVAGLLAISYTQSELGFSRVLTVHVPLGVAMIMLAAVLTAWVWWQPRNSHRGPGAARTDRTSEPIEDGDVS